ncbi:MAG: rRNA pseudouridine synthase [Epsilonproteobacteria bacterium]|nr:MAG: rRNA pseudouridine synthase [Campylobacterota bacterium]
MMRLNKFIAHYTTYSRREADRAIQDGYVKIDNELETNPATQVDDYATGVSISGKRITPTDQYTVIVYNKGKGELVTKNDPKGRRTIYDTLDNKYKHFIPVGRLDYASEGVLLLTDASRIANILMSSPLERVYKIKIKGSITEAMEEAMRKGLILDDASAGAHALSNITSMEFAPFYAYNIIKNNPNYSILKVSIGEGKNRELRRFFAHFGTDVADLKRLNYGGVELNNLPTGKSRFLSRKEYNDLRQFMKDEKQKGKERGNLNDSE